MRNKVLSVALLVILLISAGGFGGCAKKADKVTVTLDWTPNTNHTGLYVAKDKGYFAAEGLEVEIIQPPVGMGDQLVGSNQAQFGVSNQEAVTLARLEEIPIVSIAAVIQHNTSGFASLKSKGIETPKDFEGKRYGGWGSPIEEATIKALMDKYGADAGKVEILTTGSADFLVTSEANADFSWIFYGWDGIAAEVKGVELNYIKLTEAEPILDYHTPVLITNEENIANNPELVRKFLAAVKKGYEFTIANPDEAAEILLASAPELDRDLVLASQRWLSDKFQADAPAWGEQKPEVWANYLNWLVTNNLVEKTTEIEKAFTNEYLPK